MVRGGVKANMRYYWTQGMEGWGSECSGRSIFIFLIKENWICGITGHQAESKINILLTINLRIDSGIRQ